MSIGISLRSGKLVPIIHFISDKNSSLYVQAKIYDHNNTLLQTINLNNTGLGNYTYNNYYMPVVYFIRINYFIYTDSDYSIPDTSYTSDFDVFYRDISPESTISSNDLVGTIENNDLIGFVESDNLNELTGFVQNDSLVGFVERDETKELIGYISNDLLTGNIA